MKEKKNRNRIFKIIENNTDKVFLLEKGKKGIQQAIFGRTLFIFLSMLLQLGLFLAAFTIFRNHLTVMVGTYYGLVVIVLLIIINRNMNPNMKLPWVLISLLLPVTGGLFYLYVELSIDSKLVSKVVDKTIKEASPYTRNDAYVLADLKENDPAMYNLAGYLSHSGNGRIYGNTEALYFPSGEAFLPDLLEELERAEQFIFLEFFIIKEGLMWGEILNILKKKAEEGVQVCVLYDGFNTLTNLPVRYPRELESLGIECKVFFPIRPIFSTIYNNRDHRKIIVIDGKTAYTGGVNLSDEYINEWERFGYWKDSVIRLKGDAVHAMTGMFLQMWNLKKPELPYERYLGVPEEQQDIDQNLGYIQPYGDNPLDDRLVGKNVYLTVINRAVRNVSFMTPYLVLDHEIKEALIFAAERGVEVNLILPHIPDKKTAYSLAKNHYPALLKGGVHIYEFTPGFVHSKVAFMDDEIAVVGTINLDYRSLYHHFENGVLLYHTPVISKIREDFEKTISLSHEITWTDVKNEKKLLRLMGYLLKVIAPLM